FRLPNGTGEAKGVEYYANEGRLQLKRDVKFNLAPTPSKGSKPTHAEPVEIRGSHLEFDRDSRVMRLSGPAQAATAQNQLKAGAFLVELDENFRARKLIANAGSAGARPEFHSQDPKGARVMNSDSMTAILTAEGKIARIEAQGSVTGSTDGAEE